MKAVLSQERSCNAAAVCFILKFTDSHFTFKSSQAPKARLQSSRHIGTKRNLELELSVKCPFKVTYFGVSGKATRV